ncbi:branched-chain amino acid transaminase [Pseudohoeflea coraliihabitans]|uniref:Branched-chain-amino-acid aminotransferase n=1 Tax=Pseudohoeflea coraliihabitans TaxID=2860393 RepID=A0ABS6WP34_9HYPH|nr:branched-chain amino acid transaminase [Pseudohoeflea sp. DP4N28-3]MBW3097167.1 branched-chain amino acid transaminase [Pseudohoeflea sp. DP4N28-3]
MNQPKYITMNGELVPYADAKVHVLTPTVKYGALVFEGLRAYWNSEHEQLYVVKLPEHLARFHATIKAMRFDASYTDEELVETVVSTLRANEVRSDVHLRLAAYVEGTALYNSRGPISLMCAAYGRGSGPIEDKAVAAGVVSWRRISDSSMPPRLKVAANYHNARLGSIEAETNGYDEAIFLTQQGHVAEGAGSCLMMVRDGVLVTPTRTDGILESITRQAILDIALTLGIPTEERSIDRTELYFASEAFFCGTGVEIAPVTSIDRLEIGDGTVGQVTRKLWARYEANARGTGEEASDWCTTVYDGDGVTDGR